MRPIRNPYTVYEFNVTALLEERGWICKEFVCGFSKVFEFAQISVQTCKRFVSEIYSKSMCVKITHVSFSRIGENAHFLARNAPPHIY